MAKDEQGAEGQQAAPKSKKGLVIAIIALVLVLALGGAAALMLMGGKGKKHDKEEEHDAEAQAKPVVVAFEEKFTVNLMSEDGSSHYLQVPKLELEVADAEIAKRIEESKSKISDRISSVLRSKNMNQMLEPGSDIKLKEELKKVINDTLDLSPSEASKKGVKEVILPASFIVQ